MDGAEMRAVLTCVGSALVVSSTGRRRMRIAAHRSWLVLLAAGWSLAIAAGVPPAPITSELQVSRVQSQDGQDASKPATVTNPGDVLEYHLSYANHSAGAVSGLVAKLPIPSGTTLTDLMQVSPQAEASTDGTRYAPLPLTRVVKHADGTEQRVSVPLEEYRSLRWNLGSLPAGGIKQVHARVRVNSVSQASAPTAPATAG
jgi:hypothetical protein